MFKTIVFASAAATALVGVASAESEYEFEVNRSELSTSSGVERTLKRIDRFATEFCGANDRRTLQQRAAAIECRDAVTAEIVAQIDSPQLTEQWRDGRVYALR